MTSGTTSVAPAADSAAYDMEPKATGPVPGTRTSSRTTAVATTRRHHSCAAAKRSGPCAVSSSARPQPTRPSPRRTQLETWRGSSTGGRSASRSPGESRATVRATSGVPRGRAARPGSGRVVMSRASLRRARPRVCRRAGIGEDGAHDPRQPRQGPPRRRRHVRRRRREVRHHQRRALPRSGPAVAQGRRPRRRRPAGRARARHRGRDRHLERAVRRPGRRGRPRRLLPRHARRRATGAGPTSASPLPTRCACRSPTSPSTW